MLKKGNIMTREPCWACKGPDGECLYPKSTAMLVCPVCGCSKETCEVEDPPNNSCATGRCD